MLARGKMPHAASPSPSGIESGSSWAASQASMPWAWASSTNSGVSPKVMRRSMWRTGSSVARIVGTVTVAAAAAALAVGKTFVGAGAGAGVAGAASPIDAAKLWSRFSNPPASLALIVFFRRGGGAGTARSPPPPDRPLNVTAPTTAATAPPRIARRLVRC